MGKVLVALYTGNSVAEMQLLGASTDPGLVRDVTRRLLKEYEEPDTDPYRREIRGGQRRALSVLAGQIA